MTGRIDRVVVTLDVTSENEAPIDTAVRLAARAHAPVHGVFVEDEDLLALANLPVSRQVTVGGRANSFTAETMELHLRLEAERARQELFAAAKRESVTCTFEVVRGAPTAAVAGASERDLVVAGALTRPLVGHFRVECRWWSTIGIVSGPLLLTRHVPSRGGGVVLLLRDRSAASTRLLDTAAQLAEANDSALTVICPANVAGSPGFVLIGSAGAPLGVASGRNCPG
jgi:hypothetical protein